jgi:formylmethanofuran dehydrogenase subunit B
MRAAGIAIPLATVGVESGGTIFRADGVPLALRPPIAAQLPADHEALGVLRAAIVEATGKCTPRARREETT